MSGVPEWAMERVWPLFYEERRGRPHASPETIWQTAFARFIAKHEDPPVDPLLIEAREIVVKYGSFPDADVRDGGFDSSDPVECALAALRRGIELAKAKERA